MLGVRTRTLAGAVWLCCDIGQPGKHMAPFPSCTRAADRLLRENQMGCTPKKGTDAAAHSCHWVDAGQVGVQCVLLNGRLFGRGGWKVRIKASLTIADGRAVF